MRVTRRNVLLVLGVLTVAGGTVFGAGAFSQVQADRTVTANAVADGNAYLNMTGDGSYATETGDDGTIEFQFESLNENATSTFDGVLTVTPEPADDSGPYYVYVDDDQSAMSSSPMDVTDGTSSIVGQNSAVEVGANTAQELSVEFDLTDASADEIPRDITIVATDTDPSP